MAPFGVGYGSTDWDAACNYTLLSFLSRIMYSILLKDGTKA